MHSAFFKLKTCFLYLRIVLSSEHQKTSCNIDLHSTTLLLILVQIITIMMAINLIIVIMIIMLSEVVSPEKLVKRAGKVPLFS